MASEEAMEESALRWLEHSGGLKTLKSALVARLQISPRPKVLKVPVHVNISELNEIEEELATLVMERPIVAQRVFHRVIHTTAVALSLELKSQPHKNNPSLSTVASEGDHCPPAPLATIPDTSDIASLYSDSGMDLDGVEKTKTSNADADRIDFELTMASLEFDLPIDTAIVKDSADILTMAQIHAPLSVNGIPWGPEWIVGGVTDLPLCLNEPMLAQVNGRVLSFSLPKSYTVWARYLCSSAGCVGMSRDLHVRVFAVGSLDDEIMLNKPLCRVCQSELYEDPSARELGEKTSVFLLPDAQAYALRRNTYTRAQALTVIFRDEMLVGLVPGQKLQATVMVVPRGYQQYPKLEGILVHPPPPLRPHSPLPPMFRKLVEDRQSSPWSLVLTLAYMFATTVVPAGTFHTLKLALLLSLASCLPDKAGLAVLAVGSNTTFLLRLLSYGARYAPHSVVHSSLDSVTASLTKDSEGQLWVQTGSLLLAHGGVCLLGDFSKFKKDARHSVCSALESGMVQVESTVRLRPHTTTLRYPLRAAAWACYDPAYARGRSAMETDDTFLHVPLGDLSKSITDVFGLVVYTETPGGECESQAEDVITLHTLLDATRPESPSIPLLPQEDLKQYLAMVRGLEIVFSAGAERLVRGYYVAARRLRGDCIQGAAVPVTAIHTLAQVAASHARLALRCTVESWDAVAAILLCEEGLAAHFGYSLFQVPPTPHLSASEDLHKLVGRKNDERMMKFQKQLEEFIEVHTGDISSTL